MGKDREQEGVLQEITDTSVLVCVAGKRRPIYCVDSFCDVVYQEETGEENVGKFFNNSILKSYDLYVFLGPQDRFATPDSLQQLIDIYRSAKFIGFCGIYSDYIVTQDQKEICYKANPPYDSSLYHSRSILNFPFVCTQRAKPVFNTKLNQLCMWSGMISLCRVGLLYHIPKPIFAVENSVTGADVFEEMKIVNAECFT